MTIPVDLLTPISASGGLTEVPNLPLMVLGVVALLLGTVAYQTKQHRSVDASGVPPESASYATKPRLAAAVIAVTMLYVLAMQMSWLGFRPATLVFVFSVGILLGRFEIKRIPILLLLAAMMSFGLHWLFTNVLSVVLP